MERLKALMQDGKKLKVSSLHERAMHGIRAYVGYCHHSWVLWSFLGQIYRVLLTIGYSVPLLMVHRDTLWNEESGVRNVLKMLDFFVSYGGHYVDTETTTFYIHISLIALLYLYMLICTLVYNYKKKIPIAAVMVSNIVFEFLLPVIGIWTASQLASALFLAFRVGGSYLLHAIVLGFISLINMFFDYAVVRPQINYAKSRQFSWLGSEATLMYIGLFITQLAAKSAVITITNTAFIVWSSVLFLIQVYLQYSTVVLFPYLSDAHGIISASLHATSLIGFLALMMRYFWLTMTDTVFTFFYGIIFISIYLGYSRLFKKRDARLVACLEYTMAHPEKFGEYFKDEFAFLRAVRLCFRAGNPDVLTWAPFEMAINEFGEQKSLYCQWIRFVAIFYEQNSKLDELVARLRRLNSIDPHVAGILLQAKDISNRRTRKVNGKIKAEFRVIDEMVAVSKATTATFWNNTSELLASTAYENAKQVKAINDEIERRYIQLLQYYPNCTAIAHWYGRYLRDVVFDTANGEFWIGRAKFMHENKAYFTDTTHTLGFTTFPYLPRTLAMENIELEDISESFSQASNGSRGLGAFVEADTDITPSYIRSMGLDAPLPFMRILHMLVSLFFVVAFVLCPFIPTIYASIKYSALHNVIEVLYSTESITATLSRLSYYLTLEAARIDGAIAEYSSEYQLLTGSTDNEINNPLPALVSQFESQASRLAMMINDNLGIHSAGSLYYHNAQMTISGMELAIEAGLAYLSSQLHMYPVGAYALHTSYSSADWFMMFIANSPAAINVLEGLNDAIIDEIIDDNNHITQTTMVLAICFAVFSAVVVGILLYYSLNIGGSWTKIIHGIASLPTAAFQGTISHFIFAEKDDFSTRKASQNYQTLSHLSAKRDGSSGIPIYKLVVHSGLLFIISLVSVFAVYYVTENTSTGINAFPEQIRNCFNAITNSYALAHYVVRRVAVDNSSPFVGDTAAALAPLALATYTKFSFSLGNMTVGTNNSENTGVYSLGSNIDDVLFTMNGNFTAYSNTLDRLKHLDALFYLSFLKPFISRHAAQTMLASPLLLTGTDEELITMVHHYSNIVYDSAFMPVIYALGDYVGSELNTSLAILFLVASAVLLIGAIGFARIYYIIFAIKRVMNYSLSLLAMIDARYIVDSPVISNIFEGDYNDQAITVSDCNSALTETEKLSGDVVFVVSDDLTILHLSPAAVRKFSINTDLAIGQPLTEYINFEDASVAVQLEQFYDSLETELQLHCKYSIEGNEEYYESTLELRRANGSLVIFFERTSHANTIEHEYTALEEKIRCLKEMNIPSNLISHVEEAHFKCNHIIIVVIHPHCNYDQIDECMGILIDNATLRKDCTYVQHLGLDFVFIFNAAQQSQVIHDAAEEMLKFIQCSRTKLSNIGIESSFGATVAKRPYLGKLMMGRIGFTIFTPTLQLAHLLAFKAGPSGCVFTKDIINLIEHKLHTECTKLRILAPNGHTIIGYSYHSV